MISGISTRPPSPARWWMRAISATPPITSASARRATTRFPASFQGFYRGYRRHASLSAEEISYLHHAVALRHFAIQPRIVRCQGGQCMDAAAFNQQHAWLMRRQEQCARRAGV